MQPVDIFVAAYLVCIMAILCVLSVLAYRKQAKKKGADNEEKE
ncbi:MAG: hypothetical protein ACI4PC_02765 [Oscillospiraceae bacterium]